VARPERWPRGQRTTLGAESRVNCSLPCAFVSPAFHVRGAVRLSERGGLAIVEWGCRWTRQPVWCGCCQRTRFH